MFATESDNNVNDTMIDDDVMRQIEDDKINKINKQNKSHLKNSYKVTEFSKVCELCVVSKQMKIIHYKEI